MVYIIHSDLVFVLEVKNGLRVFFLNLSEGFSFFQHRLLNRLSFITEMSLRLCHNQLAVFVTVCPWVLFSADLSAHPFTNTVLS